MNQFPNKFMKYFLFFIAFAFHCIFSYAQKNELNFQVKWGAEIDASRSTTLNDIVGYDATGIYAIKEKISAMSGKSYSTELLHINSNLTPDRSFNLEFEEDGNACEVNEVLQLRNRLFIFYSYRNKKEKKKFLLVDEIDKNSMKAKGQKQKIGEIDYSGNSQRNSGNFSVRVSRDSSKVLAFYSLPDTKGDPQAFGFNVLNSDMKSLWDKNVTIPYEAGLFDIESFRVDNDGGVYLLGLLYKDKRKDKRHGDPNYSYEAFAYNKNANEPKQYTLALPDRFLTDMEIEVLNNTLVCAGFYSTIGTSSIRGTYFFTVDLTTKAIKTKSVKEFDIDFIAQSLKKGDAKRAQKADAKGKEVELTNFALDKLLIGKDGSAVLIAEQRYVQVITSRTGGATGMSTTTRYYYNKDIVVVKVDAAGQILWAEKVAKQQSSTNDNGFFLSYCLGIIKGKICFIFNDNPKNLGYSGVGRPESVSASTKKIVMIVSLDKEGKQTRQAIFSGDDVDVIARPKVCEQISNQEVILFGQKRKTQQFARVTFE